MRLRDIETSKLKSSGYSQGNPGTRDIQCDECGKPAHGLRGWWMKTSHEYDEWEVFCRKCLLAKFKQWGERDIAMFMDMIKKGDIDYSPGLDYIYPLSVLVASGKYLAARLKFRASCDLNPEDEKKAESEWSDAAFHQLCEFGNLRCTCPDKLKLSQDSHQEERSAGA